MKPIKTKIEIEISKMDVDERYYQFDYKVFLNGKKIKEDVYCNDYENGMTKAEWRSFLKRGYAVQEIIESLQIETN